MTQEQDKAETDIVDMIRSRYHSEFDGEANYAVEEMETVIVEIERLKSELAEARAKAFEEAAKLIDEGFDRGIRRKQDMCSHGKFGWEDCESCASTAISKLSERREG